MDEGLAILENLKKNAQLGMQRTSSLQLHMKFAKSDEDTDTVSILMSILYKIRAHFM